MEREGGRRRRKHLNVISVKVFVRLCPFWSVLEEEEDKDGEKEGRRTDMVLYMRGLGRTEEEDEED